MYKSACVNIIATCGEINPFEAVAVFFHSQLFTIAPLWIPADLLLALQVFGWMSSFSFGCTCVGEDKGWPVEAGRGLITLATGACIT